MFILRKFVKILSKYTTKYFDISSVMGLRPETQKYDIN